MQSIFINNIKIYTILITSYIVYKIILRPIYNELRFRVKLSLKNKQIAKLNNFNYISYPALIITLLTILVTMQQRFHFIYLGKEDNYINLVISMLTLYGIFYAFIQFAIGYASQTERDKYWGVSKTKTILTENIGYKLMVSSTFKLLISVSSVYPIIKLNNEIVLYIKSSMSVDLGMIKSFVVSFWEVSIFCIFVLYIFLFAKSLLTMQWLFNIQEKKDFALSSMIKNDILEKYQDLFIESYEKRDYYFLNRLITDMNTVKLEEKPEMFQEVINNSILRFIDIQWRYINAIEKGNKISKKIIDEHRHRSYDLKEFFDDLWKFIKTDEIELDFENLLYFFKLQNSVLINQIYIFILGDEQKIINGINLTFTDSDRLRSVYFEENSFYDVPKALWNKVSTYSELTRLNHYMIGRSATKKLIDRYNNGTELQEFSKDEGIVLNAYNAYLDKLLDKCNGFLSELKKDDSLYLFNAYKFTQNKNKISSVIQEHIFHYICGLEYSEENKSFIEILISKLDYKYTVALIFYIILYTGSDSYSHWKKDILFLREVAYKHYDSENMKSKENLEHICSLISDSNIGHRISDELITWIIFHLKSDISESIIKRCINDHYLSYAKFLKLKFIFHDYGYSYPRFAELNLEGLNEGQWSDWRVGYLEEILETPNILKEELFSVHQYRFYEEVLKPDFPDSIYERKDFRLFYINHSYFISEKDFASLLGKDMYIGKGIYEFLILNLGEDGYNYLLGNSDISVVFKKEVKKIINRSNTSIVSYVDNLVSKADECSVEPFPVFGRDRIIMELQELLYDRYHA